jgi:hypothetical protein
MVQVFVAAIGAAAVVTIYIAGVLLCQMRQDDKRREGYWGEME